MKKRVVTSRDVSRAAEGGEGTQREFPTRRGVFRKHASSPRVVRDGELVHQPVSRAVFASIASRIDATKSSCDFDDARRFHCVEIDGLSSS